jgi:hypothetical protein
MGTALRAARKGEYMLAVGWAASVCGRSIADCVLSSFRSSKSVVVKRASVQSGAALWGQTETPGHWFRHPKREREQQKNETPNGGRAGGRFAESHCHGCFVHQRRCQRSTNAKVGLHRPSARAESKRVILT